MKKTREQLLSELKTGQQQLADLLETVAADQDWQPAPDEWSFRYIAAHLAKTDKDCFLDRIKRAASGEAPYFAYYLDTGRDFSRFDLQDSLQQWATNRRAIVDVVAALPDEKLLLTGTHETFGIMTILDLLQVIVDHDQEHLQALQQLLAGYKEG